MKQKEPQKNCLLPKDLKEWERMHRIVQALNEGKLKMVNNDRYRW